MTNVRCRGRETHLLNCTYDSSLASNWRYCSHTYDVGVECPGNTLSYIYVCLKIYSCSFFLIAPSNDTCTTNGDVRLVGGTDQYEGRVEVCYNRQWGTVCGRHSSWDTTDAGVACRQLGYSLVGKFHSSLRIETLYTMYAYTHCGK